MTTYLRHGNKEETERQRISLESSKSSDDQFLTFVESNNDINQNDLIIDLGCGSGFFTIQIQKKFGCKVIGIDADAKQIEAAILNAANEKSNNLEFINGLFLEKLELPKAKVVILRQVILDVLEQSKLLTWASTLLSTGGTVCTFEPDYFASILHPEPEGWGKFFQSYANYAMNGTEDWQTGRKLAKHYYLAGLQVTDIKTVVDLHSPILGKKEDFEKFIESELFNYKVDMDGLIKAGEINENEIKKTLYGFESLKKIPYSFIQTQMVAVCGKP